MHIAFDEFCRFIESNYLSIHTQRAYISDVREFLNFTDIFDESQINKFVIHLSKKGNSKRTTRRKLSSISVFFEFLKKMDLLKINPVSFIVKPKIEKFLPKFLDVDETKHLLESINNKRDRALLEIMYSSSLRASEAVGLNVEDVDFEHLRIRIKRKGGDIVYVPFSKRASECIIDYVGKREGPVFLNKYGQRISTRSVQNIVKKHALNILTKDISPHTLRHTKATHLINDGMDIRILQRFLGHSSIKATEIYTHVNMKKLANVYDKFHPLAKDDKK